MMGALDPTIASIIVALAVGLLIGLDRERHKRAEMPQTAAGLRTFALAALLGVTVAIAASGWLLLVVGAGVVALVSQSYRRTQRLHPGQTTEFALLATFAIGYLAASHVGLAAGLGVCVAILLNAKSRLHRFALTQLSEQELHDALLLAAAALIVLPLLPDRAIDPYGVFNPQVVWRLTVIILSVHALGYVARRTLGARMGLAIAGLCGGFVSSVMTIAALGRLSRSQPTLLQAAVSGAAFSSIATVVQLFLVLSLADMQVLQQMSASLSAMGLVAAAYGAFFLLAGRGAEPAALPSAGRAFDPRFAVLFALFFSLMSLLAVLAQRRFGGGGALLAVAAGGFVDTHAAAASAARLAAAGALAQGQAVIAAMLAISANTLVKMGAAWVGGGFGFAWRLWPSLLAMLAALWGVWRIGLP